MSELMVEAPPLEVDLKAAFSGDVLRYWRKVHAAHGETVRLRLGGFEAWSFAGADAIYDVLVSQHKVMVKGYTYGGGRRVMGEGLIVTDAPHWGSQRQRLNPLFTPPATEGHAGEIYDAVLQGVDELGAAAAAGEVVDLGKAMRRLTMRVISRAAFGVDLSSGNEVADAFDYTFSHSVFTPTRGDPRFKEALQLIDDFAGDLIDRSVEKPDTIALSGQIMAALEGNSHKMLRDEVVTLYLAGFETTARTMTFLLSLLGRHPQHLPALRAEAEKFRRPPDAVAVLRQLPFACEVVSEALRLYPPVAVMARQPVVDCVIGGQAVKAKSLCIINPLIVQRDTRYWPAGDAFAPDPVVPLSKRVTHRGAYVPFALGPRVCLGKHFALVEMAIATALLAGRYDWDLLDKTEPELAFQGTIRPVDPLLGLLSERAAS